jgi:hypothetical protein
VPEAIEEGYDMSKYDIKTNTAPKTCTCGSDNIVLYCGTGEPFSSAMSVTENCWGAKCQDCGREAGSDSGPGMYYPDGALWYWNKHTDDLDPRLEKLKELESSIDSLQYKAAELRQEIEKDK